MDRVRLFAALHIRRRIRRGEESALARSIILPALDILQSVPVLGFLSITVTGFMALFPGSLMGVECASIFAIFTGQVWNMTFGFYHSHGHDPDRYAGGGLHLRAQSLAAVHDVEVPASMHSLIWNSMMSFGGGWFFVLQSEAISVMNKNIKLPGLGSYMAVGAWRTATTTRVALGDRRDARGDPRQRSARLASACSRGRTNSRSR